MRLRHAIQLASAFITLLIGSSIVDAETYGEIRFTYTLGDVRALYPSATISDLKPAWAKENERLYSIDGDGIPGEIVIKFEDAQDFLREFAKSAESEEERLRLLDDANNPERRLEVSWVRWIPDDPIPLTRVIAKYGNFDKEYFNDSDFSLVRDWDRGVSALLTDDGKFVRSLTYTRTKEDRCAYAKADGRKPPSECKKQPTPSAAPSGKGGSLKATSGRK